jgi:hypothetical protein
MCTATSRERIYRLSGEEVVVVVLVIYLVGVDDRADPFNVDSLHRDTGTTLVRRALAHSSCSMSGAGDPRQRYCWDGIRSCHRNTMASFEILERWLRCWLVV